VARAIVVPRAPVAVDFYGCNAELPVVLLNRTKMARSLEADGRTPVYATDGTARAKLAECWMKGGSARALRRLINASSWMAALSLRPCIDEVIAARMQMAELLNEEASVH
jgi:hypothetical protein